MGTNLGTKKITAVVIKNLKPTGKEEWIRIEEGLYLRIRKTGKKYFVSRYTFLGKNRKITLGEYPVLKLMQARKMNLEIREKIASGIDPLQEKQKEKQEQIEAEKLAIEENLNKHKFKDIAIEWLEFKEQNIADVTYFKLLRRVENYLLPFLGDKFIEDITKKDIIDTIKKFKQVRTQNDNKKTTKHYV